MYPEGKLIPDSNAIEEEEGAIKRKEIQRRLNDQKQHETDIHAQMLQKEHLIREIELGILNTMRYRTLWRQMLIKIKMPQIVEDVEIAWHNFDRALDIKDYRISFLMDELVEAEEQYQRNTKLHIEIIDRLLRSYRERMECEERNYQRILNEALIQTGAEIKKIYYQQNDISLQSITHGIQQQLEESLNNVKSITLSKIGAFVEDSKDIQRISVAQLENQLQSSWENLGRILLDYQNKSKNRRKCYEALKDKDEKDQQEIAQQLLRTASLFEEIRKFRGKITTYDAMAKKEISEILKEHDFFQKASWTMKNRLLSDQTKNKNQLKILSIEYNKTIKYLERLVVKGKRLLILMQICRKHETRNEKVIPFVNYIKLESSQILLPHQNFILSNWDVSRQITENFQDLINFWQRFGFAQITTMQLRSERNKLKIKSSYLRECISSYIIQKKNENSIK